MGGGSKSSTSSTYETNNKNDPTTSTGGGITVGSDGAYVAQSLEHDSMGVIAEGSAIGDIVGAGAKAGGDVLQDGSVKVGNNSTINLTAMDKNTQSILDQAITVMASNANNMMTLAAGRDPNTPLADKSVEITAQTDQIGTSLSGIANIFTPARIGIFFAAIILCLWLVLSSKKRKAA